MRATCPSRKFRAINCSAIPEQLLESELFGYTPGAFTGSLKDGKKGILEICNGGTVQLDEVNKMPKYHQEKMLRVLQEGQINKVGSSDVTKIDILFIAVTNEDLARKVEEGSFAKDLYDRLSGEVLRLRPLLARRKNSAYIN